MYVPVSGPLVMFCVGVGEVDAGVAVGFWVSDGVFVGWLVGLGVGVAVGVGVGVGAGVGTGDT